MSDVSAKVIIIDAVPSDAAKIRALAVDSGIDAWSEAAYAEETARPESLVICSMKAEDLLVGFLVARIVPGSTEMPDAELYNIAVAENFRHLGVGSQLLNECIHRLKGRSVHTLWLEVRESNQPAITFYEAKGFSAQVTRSNFYTNPVENAVIMKLLLPHEMELTT